MNVKGGIGLMRRDSGRKLQRRYVYLCEEKERLIYRKVTRFGI